MRIILIFALLLLPAGEVSAIYYNNTETIEIGDGSLPEESPDSTNETGSGGGTSNPTSPNPNPTDTTDGESENPGSTATSSDPGSTGDEEDEETSVVEALIQAGALSGVTSGASGSGASGASGAGFSIRIIGAKVRQALSADIDLRVILTYWRKGKGKASESELGLIAASTALRDANVQEVAFTASSFEIVYRSRGYLLAVIPWSFPVRVMVIPSAPTIDERVSVKLPWYRFFVRKFFTVRGLQKDIDELLTKTKEGNTDGDIDERMLLFEATTEFLRTKVGTVADSVLLGSPQ
jgi:hypothetical protein